MRIEIARRDRPFSHVAGASCLLPGTCWEVTAFPTLLRIRNPDGVIEEKWKLTGPVKEFTVQQDLEKGCVWIWGRAKEGAYRHCLKAEGRTVSLNGQKWPIDGVVRPEKRERLSLGSHKAQDVDEMFKRMDLRDLLPILFHLSQWTPSVKVPRCEMMKLLERNEWEMVLRAGFQSLFLPRLVDERHQGIIAEEAAEGNPCALVTEAGRHIRNLFVQEKGSDLSLLPHLPREFISGRGVGWQCAVGELDFEWSKGTLRRAVLRAQRTGGIGLTLPKPIDSFRINAGRRISVEEPLMIEAGSVYFLDRFQK